MQALLCIVMAAAVHRFTEALEATLAQLALGLVGAGGLPQAQLLERLECRA